MGEGVFGNLVKGPVNQAVDRAVNDLAHRAEFLAALRSADTTEKYYTLLKAKGLDPKQAEYLHDWWYDGPPPERYDKPPGYKPERFWPWLQPIYPLIRRGLIKAIEEAGAALPLDSYWSAAGTEVQTLITLSQHQVTRIIVTPPTPPPTVVRKHPAPIWVVRKGNPTLQPGYFPPAHDVVVESVEGDVITWHVWDF